ncbi:MAG: pyridoxamine 5'-phosphate oxidase family protein [Candidatus Dormibacteria bacterium]
MPLPDPAPAPPHPARDRFLHWDLVTVTPWGAPAISPVGARWLDVEGTIWTSTTVGYAAKLRNIRAHPQVCLLRAAPGGEPVLLRGEARVHTGDGTANLARLFQLMGGPAGTRPFFAATTSHPFWRRLYRSYWRRVLVEVKVVEVGTLGADGWQIRRLSDWGPPPPAAAAGSRRPRAAISQRLLRARGQDLLAAGLPALLAVNLPRDRAPWAWPVEARPGLAGEPLVQAPPGLPAERLARASVATRLVDDRFEGAQMVGWLGTLEAGAGQRSLVTRSLYGFVKPPGVVGDLGAGLAALWGDARLAGRREVSAPDLVRAAAQVGGVQGADLRLRDAIWRLVEDLFARRNAAAPWYAALAAGARDPRSRGRLAAAARRAELERDWALGLLNAGGRRVGLDRLARGALAFAPNPLLPERSLRREEARVAELLRRLRAQLPPELRPPPRTHQGHPSPARGGVEELAQAALAATQSAAAALDQLVTRRLRL